MHCVSVCACLRECVSMFECLCVCRWSTKSWEGGGAGGGIRGGGVPIVNTPWGEPIKHWLRRGFKSHNQPTEIKRARWSLQITAGKYTPMDHGVYVSLSVCLGLCSPTCSAVNHSLNMQTSPLPSPGSDNTVRESTVQSSLGHIQALSIKSFQTWFRKKYHLLILFWIKKKKNQT